MPLLFRLKKPTMWPARQSPARLVGFCRPDVQIWLPLAITHTYRWACLWSQRLSARSSGEGHLSPAKTPVANAAFPPEDDGDALWSRRKAD